MLELYYAPDTCSLATHITLEEVGAEYILRLVNFSTEEQKSNDFISINPKARVPALITPHGVLTETPAMLVYVAQIYPEAALLPIQNPFQFAQLQAINSYLCSTLHVAHAHRMRGHRWSDDEAAIESMKRYSPKSMMDCYQYIEDFMLQSPWVMGTEYTIADAYLFTIAQWMESDGVNPNDYPKIVEHRSNMKLRSSVVAALDQENNHSSAT